jgi:8-oxo-dGTP pyrophosphatase MutT (NUDIX family)
MSIIDKLAWLHIHNRRALFVRSKGKDLFFNAGGKREEGETDVEALVREIREELGVELDHSTARYVETFEGPVAGKPEGTIVQVKCYSASYAGEMSPQSEIEEIGWLSSADKDRTTFTGRLILDWLAERDLID